MVKIIQLSVGGFDNNFSYLVLGGGKHKAQGVLIDPTGNAKVIDQAIESNKVKIVLQIFTHSHPDHNELIDYYKEKGVGAWVPKVFGLGHKEIISAAGLNITALHTPGHTQESVCILVEDNIFSGDTLFVKGVGTTAYGGNDSELEETLKFLFTLDQKSVLWPGHNYGGACATLGDALLNSHLKPSDKVLQIIKRKVEEYEKNQKK